MCLFESPCNPTKYPAKTSPETTLGARCRTFKFCYRTYYKELRSLYLSNLGGSIAADPS